jgi:hypothetical protein
MSDKTNVLWSRKVNTEGSFFTIEKITQDGIEKVKKGNCHIMRNFLDCIKWRYYFVTEMWKFI